MINLKHKGYKKKNVFLDLSGSMTDQEADDFLNSIYKDKYNKKCAKCNRQLYNYYPNLRSQFPILKTQLNGHDLIYLDSAATSQKPQEVIDAMTDFYSTQNASSHSVHSLGGNVTEMVEETRQVVADFIGSGVDEIVFTSGATEGINLIANGFLEVSLRDKLAAATVSPLSAEENTPSSFTPYVTPVSLETASPFGQSVARKPRCTMTLARGNSGLTKSHYGIGSFATLKMTDELKLTDNLINKFKLTKDSEILICVDQHHSNILPWQRLAGLVGCKVVFFGILPNGQWDMVDFGSKLNFNTKVIAVSNVSNVVGVVQGVGLINEVLERKFNPKESYTEQSEISHAILNKNQKVSQNSSQTHHAGSFAPLKMTSSRNRPIVVLDATQAVSHFPVKVKELDVDFVVFSGHKIYGPTGVGVLYGRRELLEVLPNYKVGGDMVESVTLSQNIYKEVPFRFEAGTANFASIIGLKTTLEWFIRSQDEIFKTEKKLGDYLIEKLLELEDIEIVGLDSGKDRIRIPLVSFTTKGVNSLDLALMLDQYGICIRSGQHCAGILHEYLGVNDTCRISLACFNTNSEIDFVIEKIKEITNRLR
jgi:cysteine desulfurase / selenocysteine lyase